VVTGFFGWLLLRLLSLSSFRATSHGVSQRFYFIRGKPIENLSCSWDEIQAMQLVGRSCLLIGKRKEQFEFSAALFGDPEQAAQALRRLLPPVLASRL